MAGAKDGGFDERSVLLRVLEAKDGVVVDIDEVGDEGGMLTYCLVVGFVVMVFLILSCNHK